MKTALSAFLFIALFPLASFAEVVRLDCEYQITARFSETVGKFDLDLSAPMTFTDENLFNLVDATGTNSKKPYKLQFQVMHMDTNQLRVTFGVYENVKQAPGEKGFTGLPLVTTTGSFADTQREISLQASTPDTTATMDCQVR